MVPYFFGYSYFPSKNNPKDLDPPYKMGLFWMGKTRTVAKFHVRMYSNSQNDVPQVAQRYGTRAPHTRRRASLLDVFVVFGMHMYSFAGLIRRTPPPTFSDTAITDRLRRAWLSG